MIELVLFDIGGTLMEYEGMPLNWCAYYYQGFNNINDELQLGISDAVIHKSVEIMKSYNPRIALREIEISPKSIFEHCLKDWNVDTDYNNAADLFFRGLNLSAKIYDDSIKTIKKLKQSGIAVGLLTDLPMGMTDEFFIKDIKSIVNCVDIYISSQSCGFRKPNKKGIAYASEMLNIPVDKILFIGDEEKDRLTAENAGCHFRRINRNYQSLADII